MGLIFVLLAAGLVIIMSTSKILFVAYGVFYTIGAYITWYPIHYLNWPYLPALLLGLATCATLAMLSYILIFRRLKLSKGGGFFQTLIGAMALGLILNQGGILIYGTVNRSIPTVIKGAINPFGLYITLDKLSIIILGVVVTLLLFWVYEKTNIGRAMRAVSFMEEVAILNGVNASRIYMMSLMLGCTLAGFAGGILAPSYGISPSMGNNVLWTVLLTVTLGGMDSLPGAVVAGIIIGEVLSFGQYYIGSTIQIYLFLLIGVILYFRNNGLMGHGVDIGI